MGVTLSQLYAIKTDEIDIKNRKNKLTQTVDLFLFSKRKHLTSVSEDIPIGQCPALSRKSINKNH